MTLNKFKFYFSFLFIWIIFHKKIAIRISKFYDENENIWGRKIFFYFVFWKVLFYVVFQTANMREKKRKIYFEENRLSSKSIWLWSNSSFTFISFLFELLFPIKRLLRKCQNYFTMEISKRKILFFTLFCTKISITWKKLSIWYKKFAFADTFVYIYDISNCYLFYSIFAYIR